MMGLPMPPSVDGVFWRSAIASDAEAIADLQEVCYRADGGFRESVAEIVERFESPMVDPESDTLVGVRDSGEAVMSLWSLVVPEPSTMWSVYDDNYTHPDYRTDVLRAFALDWWQSRSIQRVEASPFGGPASEGGDGPGAVDVQLPIRFHQHIYPHQLQHIADVTERGFLPWIYYDELRRDLSVPIETRRLPEGYEMIPAGDVTATDLLAVRNDAFRDHTGSQPWTVEMWESLQTEMYRPDASFVVVDGAEPVAFVKCSVFPNDAADRGFSEGWIEQVGTRRDHRGRGLAAALIEAAMTVFASDGIQFATLEVDTENPTGAHGLYSRLGFERADGYVDYTRVVHPLKAQSGWQL